MEVTPMLDHLTRGRFYCDSDIYALLVYDVDHSIDCEYEGEQA